MGVKKMEKSYHISKGSNEHYYILNYGSSFVKTLSTDLETAKVKAKKIVGFEVPVDIWLRQNHKNNFDYPVQYDDHVHCHNSYLYKIEKQKIDDECNARQYVGEVGETLIKKLYLYDYKVCQSSWGDFNIITLKDEDNNRFIYFGNAKCFKNWDKTTPRTFEFQIKEQFIKDEFLNRISTKVGLITEAPYKINKIFKPKIAKVGNEWVY